MYVFTGILSPNTKSVDNFTLIFNKSQYLIKNDLLSYNFCLFFVCFLLFFFDDFFLFYFIDYFIVYFIFPFRS